MLLASQISFFSGTPIFRLIYKASVTFSVQLKYCKLITFALYTALHLYNSFVWGCLTFFKVEARGSKVVLPAEHIYNVYTVPLSSVCCAFLAGCGYSAAARRLCERAGRGVLHPAAHRCLLRPPAGNGAAHPCPGHGAWSFVMLMDRSDKRLWSPFTIGNVYQDESALAFGNFNIFYTKCILYVT